MTDYLIAALAVENTAYSFDKLFDYAVPQELADDVSCGKRVLVPFGNGNRKRQAMIMKLHRSEKISGLKFIETVLDETPVITSEMAQLAIFMSDRYFCTVYDAVKAMLPPGINYNVCAMYSVSSDIGADISSFSGEEEAIIKLLLKLKKPQRSDKLLKLLGYTDDKRLLKLVKKGVLVKDEDAFRKTMDATQKMIALSEHFFEVEENLKLTGKQQTVCDLLKVTLKSSVKELTYFTGVGISVFDNLVKKGLAVYFEQEIFRTVQTASAPLALKKTTLTDEQQQAFDKLLSLYLQDSPNVSLLYGITGSGKTSVFMKLIERAYADNRGVIVMVPEISLTPQLISLFHSSFGQDVAVFHSGLSLGERLDEYKRIRQGKARIAVGTRSAAFAPFENLGLIIMDEEHEATYKSDTTPRYSAREVAKFRCARHNALLLLSSATPDVETYYHALKGTYSLCTLTKRFGTAVLPEVITADMNVETAMGNMSGFSAQLIDELNYNLENKKQSIILLNRRGYNTFVACRECKEVVTCPNCSISLTYHSANNRLMCHYCGYSQEYTEECPSCHSNALSFRGSGTQKAEAELSGFFDKARILRMDTDSTLIKFSHEKKLDEFANGNFDILVGTQMVAKGLNFPNVTLVGVLNADQMLYSDDYRAYERTFSLLTQVVGRSGRGSEKGRAIIQTLTPENPIITLAAKQDYDEFYASEINIRKAMLYPPFADICLIGFVGENQLQAIQGAGEFSKRLIEECKTNYADLPMRVLGPSAANVTKINNKYRYKIILKCKNNKRFRQMISTLLKEFGKSKRYSDITVYADINPSAF